jgi:hypothetical protein
VGPGDAAFRSRATLGPTSCSNFRCVVQVATRGADLCVKLDAGGPPSLPLSTSCIAHAAPGKKRCAPCSSRLRVAFLEVISEARLGQGYLQYSDNQVDASPMLPSGARVSSLQMMRAGIPLSHRRLQTIAPS